MKLKKGDKVIIISGKDKGKTGEIIRSLPRESRIVVAGVNLKKVHKRPTKSNQKGQIIDMAAPFHVSNAMLIDPKNNKPTRIGYEVSEGKKIRVARKSGTTIS
ncbi:MAG TPA: 50S ribosomal protein L24 [Candidatus Paceibacterota bacterium]